MRNVKGVGRMRDGWAGRVVPSVCCEPDGHLHIFSFKNVSQTFETGAILAGTQYRNQPQAASVLWGVSADL